MPLNSVRKFKNFKRWTKTNWPTLLCSIDMVSLLTNFPFAWGAGHSNMLGETPLEQSIWSKLPRFQKHSKQMLLKATTEVEFSFDGTLYKQVDGVAMGLPFMNVVVSRTSTGLSGGVYRKPTSSGLFTRRGSFCDTRQKLNLSDLLTSRSIKICLVDKINQELATPVESFANNGPGSTLSTSSNERSRAWLITLQNQLPPTSLKRKSMRKEPLLLPGKVGWAQVLSDVTWREERMSCSVTCNYARFHHTLQWTIMVESRMVFTTKHAFSGRAKDVLPASIQSMQVYEYRYCCGHLYWQNNPVLF